MADDTPQPPMVSIRLLDESHIAELLALTRRNHEGPGSAGPGEEFDEAAERARLERRLAECQQGTGWTWTIHLAGELAGDIGFNQVHRGKVQSANVGYMVDEPVRGRGVATAALRLVIREAFEEVHLHRLDAGALVTNVASQRVLEKAGFRRIGIFEKHFYENGEWHDYAWYELIGPNVPPHPSAPG
jgi:ribosomal-protein-alanine N-acetyltransferase